MNKKIKKIFEPNLRFYFVMLVAFCVVTFFVSQHNREIAIAEAAVIVLLFIYSRFSAGRRSREIVKYIESVTYNVDTATKDTLLNFPLPMAIFTLDGDKIIYSNDNFLKMTGDREHLFEVSMADVIPGFDSRWLIEGKGECPSLIEVDGRKYRVYGTIVHAEQSATSYLATTYWVDVTEYDRISSEFSQSKPVFAIILLDNYDEFLKGLSEKDKSSFVATIDDKISDWTARSGGYLSKFDRDRYVFLFEERYLQHFIDAHFSLLDTVRSITSPSGIPATVSIGIGKDGKNFAENYQFASLSIEMALSRGGDQAVIKNRFNFEFYGGRTSQLEKRTKVKSRVMASSLVELMRDASGIFIMGHKFADLDSVGSAIGLCCAARKVGREAHIVLDPARNAAQGLVRRMSVLPEYAGVFITPQDAILNANSGTLLIVVDTNRPEQVESENLLMSCTRVAVIDHHRRAATYIQNAAFSFHEPYASSTCELVTELLQYMVEQTDILRAEAEALLSGIVLDTKSFTLRTGGRTFDAAAFLRRAGADTTDVKRLLQTDMATAQARYAIVQKAKVYKAGIAIAASETEQSRIIAAQAADELLNISGIQASFVVFPEGEYANISARSIGDINVQVVVEKLGGGGNRSTAGAQIKNKSVRDVTKALLAAIDAYLAENPEHQAKK